MSLIVEKLKFEKARFEPAVNVEGLSIKMGAATFEHGLGDGSVEATSIDFSASDAGKLFYLSLVRRKGAATAPATYHLIVQSPSVLKPMVPELDQAIDVLFTFATGSVRSDGTSIDVTVRHFHH